MPNRRNVPSLKTISLRSLAWPDAINKSTNPKKNFPSVQSYVRNTFVAKHFERTREIVKRKQKRNMTVDKKELKAITENVVNAWIKLSNFYETRINEIASMAPFMKLSTIGSLDFLHEGFIMRNEKNFIHNILPYIGVIPFALRPQLIDFRTWFDIIEVIMKEGVAESLHHLFIPFGNDKVLRELRTETLPEEEVDHLQSSLVFRFTESFEHFMNLRTIVVRGDAIQDDFMNAIGENCVFLEHLDVRGTQITDRGVILLLFKKVGQRFFRGSFISSSTRFEIFPEAVLNQCCSTLRYLDVSKTIRRPPYNNDTGNFYDTCVIKACPQLRATPLQFYYNVPGKTRIVLKDMNTAEMDTTLVRFRQQLVRYLRQSQTQKMFEFVKVLFTCMHFEDPKLEVMENETGEEVAFLMLSGSAVILHVEVKNLTALTLISYARNVTSFLPIELIAKTAPKLEKLKCALKGELHEAVEMKHLKFLTSPMVRTLDTLQSIVEFCPQLEYLEIKDILLMDSSQDFDQDVIERVFSGDPGSYRNLEVVRFLFPNRLVLYPGLSWIAVRCPKLRIVGDLAYWGVPYDTLLRIFANTTLYNHDFAIEHKGVLHFSGKLSEDIMKLE